MRYNNIQILRIVGAVAVVVTHVGMHARLVGVEINWCRHSLLAGFPVPLLFAVSGFILTHVLQTAPVGRYLTARILRLYPGYWLALLGVVAIMRLRLLTEHHRWLIYFVNWREVTLWPSGTGQCLYFLGSIEWTLLYEFYLSISLAGLSLLGVRRGLPAAVGIWLAAIFAKMLLWRGYAFDAFPHWSTIAVSAYCVPFLFGVLVYYIQNHGRRWRWAVLPVAVAIYISAAEYVTDPELQWCVSGVGAASLVWLAVNLRDCTAQNRLVRAGDWTYGLYLVHTPLILIVYYAAIRGDWSGRSEIVWAAGVVAIVGGLSFGRLESEIHARLRPLAKLRIRDLIPDWNDIRSWYPIARIARR